MAIVIKIVLKLSRRTDQRNWLRFGMTRRKDWSEGVDKSNQTEIILEVVFNNHYFSRITHCDSALLRHRYGRAVL